MPEWSAITVRVNRRSGTIAGEWVEVPKVWFGQGVCVDENEDRDTILPQLISGQHQFDDQQLQQENGLKLQGYGLDSAFASMRINTEIIDQCATPEFPLAISTRIGKRDV
jgi:hypothetical protein